MAKKAIDKPLHNIPCDGGLKTCPNPVTTVVKNQYGTQVANYCSICDSVFRNGLKRGTATIYFYDAMVIYGPRSFTDQEIAALFWSRISEEADKLVERGSELSHNQILAQVRQYMSGLSALQFSEMITESLEHGKSSES